MEAKEFLRQYQNALTDIRNMESEVEELEAMAMGISGKVEMANIRVKNTSGGEYTERRVMEKVQSSLCGDSMAAAVAKICDMEIEIMKKRTDALDKLREIGDVIRQVENKDYRQLLHRRYIEGNTWERIAVEMGFNYRWVLRLHGRALKEITEIINRP